ELLEHPFVGYRRFEHEHVARVDVGEWHRQHMQVGTGIATLDDEEIAIADAAGELLEVRDQAGVLDMAAYRRRLPVKGQRCRGERGQDEYDARDLREPAGRWWCIARRRAGSGHQAFQTVRREHLANERRGEQ